MTTPIREEFEKACLTEANRACKANEIMEIPLFAAKWMAERCAKEADEYAAEVEKILMPWAPRAVASRELAEKYRQLAKDLQ